MIPLVIDDKKIKALREYAERNPLSLAEVKRIVNGDATPPGDRKNHCCFLDFGFKVVFSIEHCPLTDGNGSIRIKHLTVSLTEPTGTRMPSVTAVRLLASALGMEPLEKCAVTMQQEGTPKYIEVVCEHKRKKTSMVETSQTEPETDLET